MHNASTVTYYPYCYKGEELLIVKYHEDIMAISFVDLYKTVNAKEIYDKNNNSYCKYPEDLYVKDLVNGEEIWTKINKLCTHKNDKPMRFIKTANGLSICVTEDHPIISGENEIPASEITTEDYETTHKVNPFTNSVESFKNLSLTKDLGYLLGVSLIKGTTVSNRVILNQRPGKVFDKISQVVKDHDIPNYLNTNSHKLQILKCDAQEFIYNILKNKSKNKVLPPNYIHFSDEFLQGVLAGIIDVSGNTNTYKNKNCVIKLKSRTLLNQLSLYLQSKNIFTNDLAPYTQHEKKICVYSMDFNLPQNEDFILNIGSIKINDNYIHGKRNNFKNNFNYGDVSVVSNEETFDEESVYDISTETGHFICNNTLVHNCYAYDLSRLATEGLFFLNNYNNEPPQHLTTFLDDVIEFVSFMSNRSSGKIVPFCFFSANQRGQQIAG